LCYGGLADGFYLREETVSLRSRRNLGWATNQRQRARSNLRREAVTRLTDLPPAQAQRLAELECPDFETRPWVTGPALSRRRVAIVSSAGLVVRGEDPFRGRDPDYRVIPAGTRPEDLLISHISINF